MQVLKTERERETPVTAAARGRGAQSTRMAKGTSLFSLHQLCILNCVAQASFIDLKIIFRRMYSLSIYYISGTSPHTRHGLSHSILFHLYSIAPFIGEKADIFKVKSLAQCQMSVMNKPRRLLNLCNFSGRSATNSSVSGELSTHSPCARCHCRHTPAHDRTPVWQQNHTCGREVGVLHTTGTRTRAHGLQRPQRPTPQEGTQKRVHA